MDTVAETLLTAGSRMADLERRVDMLERTMAMVERSMAMLDRMLALQQQSNETMYRMMHHQQQQSHAPPAPDVESRMGRVTDTAAAMVRGILHTHQHASSAASLTHPPNARTDYHPAAEGSRSCADLPEGPPALMIVETRGELLHVPSARRGAVA